MRNALSTPASRASVAALAVALLLAAWSMRRALVIDTSTPLLPATATRELPRITRPVSGPEEELLAVVETDPFHPQRHRAEAQATGNDEAVKAAGSLLLRLIGTVVLPDGRSFAICEAPGEEPKLIRLGEALGQYVLKSVEPARAIFVAADGAPVIVHVAKPGT